MFNVEHLREHIVRPALDYIGLSSPAAINLLLGTAAVESRLGTYLVQNGGPALGIFQIEPDTHADVWVSWLRFRADDAAVLRRLVGACWWLDAQARPHHNALIADLTYACAIARLVYRRAPAPLPAADDWASLAAYWVTYYNRGGKGTVQKFLDACEACGVMH